MTLTAAAASGSTFVGWAGAGCSGTGTCVVTMSAAESVTATFNPQQFQLSVTDAGTGSGTVTSVPSGIDCPTGGGTGCNADFNSGTVVTLTAAPGTGSTFVGWSGACTGTGTCAVTMSAAESVTATFNTTTFALTVTKAGTGTGTVTSNPAGINCGTTCSANFASGSQVVLTAAAGTGSTFAGWSGNPACSGTGTCTITMSAAESVTATFNTTTTFTLTYIAAGTGTGTVTSVPAGINCTQTCTNNFPSGTQVTLTEVPSSGSTFAGWSGACSGTATTCNVTMNSAESVTATFNLVTYPLTVTDAGTGSGTVTSNTGGIDCITGSTANCSANYNSGTTVTLTATAASGSTFTGWSGACAGTGTCSLTMSAAESVTATFTPTTNPTLTVVLNGTAYGTVTGGTANQINCHDTTGVTQGTCTLTIVSGSAITLGETPFTGSVFGGWSGGGCSGTASTCSFTLTANTTVTATFNNGSGTYPFTVVPTAPSGGFGTGTGTVTSSPSGINCTVSNGVVTGGTCTFSFASGALVTLTENPAAGSVFTEWSGSAECGTATTCTIVSFEAQTVDVTFTAVNYTLTVTEAGTGSGTVTSSPAGINCPTTCSASYASGTQVTLSAVAGPNSAFAGWFGEGCTGTGTCTVTMNAAEQVQATFNPTSVLTVTEAGTGFGTVSSNPAGILCPSTCSAPFTTGSQVTLTVTANSGSTFAGWSGAGCSGVGVCTVTMSAAESVTATFNTSTTFALTVTETGTGSGTVTSNPSGISCPSTCSANYASGTVVTLTETPASGSTFAGWSGACTGTGTCTVTMNAAENVTAMFNTTASPTLTIVLNGTGTGSVTFTSSSTYTCSDTTGVVTGTCSASFASGTVVNVSEVPGTGSTFGGWSGGGCSGTGSTCNVTLTTNTTVTATFNKPTYAVTVSETGTGTGTVTSSPSGISCPSTCAGNFTSGTQVTLTPTAGAGSVFAGWSDATCVEAGTGACTFTVNGAVTVQPVFNKGTYTLTVTLAGTGSGTVTSSPAGISCPDGCSASYTGGTQVTLTETAGSGSTFAGWSGACSGTGTCTVTMNAAEAVTATFNTGSTFTFAPSAGSSTSVTTTPGGNIVVGFTLTGTVKETVDLGCTSSAPQYLSCLITPNVVNLTGTGTTQVAIVLTSYCQGEVPGGPAPGRGLPPVGGVGVLLLALTLVGMAWSYGRRRRWVLTMAGLLIITLSGAACGNLPQGPNGVTPAGNYVLTITATVAGQAPQLVQVNVKVN